MRRTKDKVEGPITIKYPNHYDELDSASHPTTRFPLSNLNRSLLTVLLSLTALIPFFQSSRAGMIDPFTHGITAVTIHLIREGSIQLHGSIVEYIPGSTFFVGGLSLVAGIPPETLEYVPIVGPLAVLFSTMLAFRLTSNRFVALLAANVLSLRFFGFWLYSIWPHAFGYALFLCFLTVLVSKTIGWLPKVTITWIMFVGMQLYSYNTELWMIALVAFMLLLRLRWPSSKPRKATARTLPFSWSFLCATVVTFLGLDQVLYGSYLPRLVATQGELLTSLEYNLSILLKTNPPLPYSWVPESSVWLIGLQLLWYALIFTPIFVGLVAFARTNGLITSLRGATLVQATIAGLGFVWIIDVLTYASIGGIRAALFRVPTLVAPVVAMTIIKTAKKWDFRGLGKMGSSRRLITYSIGLAAVSAGIFGLSISEGYYVTSTSHYADAKSSAIWLESHQPTLNFIFSDHNTQGEFAIEFAKIGRSFDPNNLYTEESFSHLVDPRYATTRDSYYTDTYVVINTAIGSQRTMAGGWIDFQPILPHLSTINANINLSRISDDGRTCVFIGS